MNGESSPVVVSPIEDFLNLFNNVVLGESVSNKFRHLRFYGFF